MSYMFGNKEITPCYIDAGLQISYTWISGIENPAIVIRPTHYWTSRLTETEKPGYPVILKPHAFLYRFSGKTWELYQDVKTDWQACELVRIITSWRLDHYIATRPGNLPYSAIIGAHEYYYEGEKTVWEGVLRFPNMYYGDLINTVDPYYKTPPTSNRGNTGHFNLPTDYKPSNAEALYGKDSADKQRFQWQCRLDNGKQKCNGDLCQSKNLVKSTPD